MRTLEDIKTIVEKVQVTSVNFQLLENGQVSGYAQFHRTYTDDDGVVLKSEQVGVAVPSDVVTALPAFVDAYAQFKDAAYAGYDANVAAQLAALAKQKADKEAAEAKRLADAKAIVEAAAAQ